MSIAKIILADPHTLTREGLKVLLSRIKNIQICSEVFNSQELMKQCMALSPDIIILDYAVSGFSITDVAWVKNNMPHTRIIVISYFHEKEAVLSVLSYGVNGYLLKECDEEEIQQAIKSALKNEKFFCNKVMDSLLEKAITPIIPFTTPVNLSTREYEIIQYITKGLTAKEIAELLHLSVHTITTHRKNIFKKLHIRKTSELINYALQKI